MPRRATAAPGAGGALIILLAVVVIGLYRRDSSAGAAFVAPAVVGRGRGDVRRLLRSTAAAAASAEPPTDARPPPSSPTARTRGAISTKIPDLSAALGGTGRAKLCWDCYKIGVDPALRFSSDASADEDADAAAVFDALLLSSSDPAKVDEYAEGMRRDPDWRREAVTGDVLRSLPTLRKNQRLGAEALRLLASTYAHGDGGGEGAAYRVEGGVASLSHVSVSSDGTTKLLLRLRDGLEVETVLIPWFDDGKRAYSTLCVSSQVGCRMGCTFCATGRMGRARNLTSDEILAQYFYAQKVCRLGRTLAGMGLGSGGGGSPPLPEITNVVFMGMGEPADNADEVNAALRILTDVGHYRLSPAKVTVSTVGPTPGAFRRFAQSPCVLAWSVHAADDELRRRLVPTTKYAMEELRRGLVDALLGRPEGGRMRDAMLEVALMDGVNDGPRHADELADLALRVAGDVPGCKLLVNLIPYNSIGHPTYRKPSEGTVRAFQERLWERGVYVHVRSTRGDDESAACGQLATRKRREREKVGGARA